MLGALYMWLLRRRQTACRNCPHGRDSHLPYIPGDDRPGYCAERTGPAACHCWQYKPERAWALAMAFLRQRPEPVTASVLRPRPVRLPVPDPVGYDDRTHLDIPIARPYARVPRPKGRPR